MDSISKWLYTVISDYFEPLCDHQSQQAQSNCPILSMKLSN